MAYRLNLDLSGGVVARALFPGENIVGSDPDCDLQIGDPTVSRHHAVIVVGSSGNVQVADLGSSNGTSIEGRRLRGPEEIHDGFTVHFGAVAATLEEIADSDLEPARMSLSPAVESRSPVVRQIAEEAKTTASVQPVQLLALVSLPRVVKALASGEDQLEVARQLGTAVMAALPITGVDLGADEEAPFFVAGSEAVAGGESGLVVHASGVSMSLFGGSIAGLELLKPLLEAGCSLVAVAGATGRPMRTAEAPAEDPVWPEPRPLDPKVQEIYSRALRVATSPIHVLIRGESGTGKEVLARFIHGASKNKDGEFQALNCAALPADLLEAELFGIERGVATGVDARPGYFERADGGTLFLDEIGDMAPQTQAKILRVLQEGEVYRIGGSTPRPAQVRVISATNRNLQGMLDRGEFRLDLYHRIADWDVELPALRERKLDIPNLAAWFLGREMARHARHLKGLSRAALQALVRYDWPGNIRQLEREIARAALFATSDELLDTSCLSDALTKESHEKTSLKSWMAAAERSLIQTSLAEAGGDVGEAAKALGVPQSTMYRKIKTHGLDQ